jgi:hypothetical protein
MLTDAEQIEHLELIAHHAGLKLPEVVLPESHHIVIHRMRFHYLDWGYGSPAYPVPPRRRAELSHLGRHLFDAAAGLSLRRA